MKTEEDAFLREGDSSGTVDAGDRDLFLPSLPKEALPLGISLTALAPWAQW